MDAELLARLQFTLTASYHFIFPPLSMGLGLMLLVVSGMYLRTKDPKWRRLSFFWVKIYGIVFAMGVATGVVMEFEFGMNWAEYSRFVGNVFGSLLAAEGVFAFFLEGGFLGLMLFGGNRLGPKMWFLASLMVVVGAHFSAVWIVAANSWMQTPAGYEIQALPEPARAVMTDFWAVLFTPSFVTRLMHVFFASWTAGAAFVASVGAWYILKKKSDFGDLGRASLSIALPAFIVFAVANAFIFGPESARNVAENQPTKLAAMEGIWETEEDAPAYLIGWVDEGSGETIGLAVPGLLSFLSGQDTVTGVNDFETPPTVVNLTFQTYHFMVALGMAIVPFALLSAGLWFWKRRLLEMRWALWIVVSTVFVSLFVITAGWWTAELGRQPWIVYELLRTTEATSAVVSAEEIVVSLGGFLLIYTLLLALFLYLLNNKIQHGPAPLEEVETTPVSELPDTLRGIFSARGSGEER
ncbi:MAG: cytochrome ubiquinol oxidase subunit I, partial [Chloroflexota bacterium]